MLRRTAEAGDHRRAVRGITEVRPASPGAAYRLILFARSATSVEQTLSTPEGRAPAAPLAGIRVAIYIDGTQYEMAGVWAPPRSSAARAEGDRDAGNVGEEREGWRMAGNEGGAAR